MVGQQQAQEVLDAFRDVVRGYRRRALVPAVREAGVPGSVLTLLGLLDGHGPCRVGDLAALAGTGAGTTSRQAALAEDLGLVVRGPDPADGRACRLTPSPDGLAVLHLARAAQLEQLRQVLAGWDDADVDTLARLLRRLLAPRPEHHDHRARPDRQLENA